MKILNKIFMFFTVVMALNGCVSQIVSLDKYTKGWIGSPVEELKAVIKRPESYPSRIEWKETTYQLSNGNWVYVEPVRPDCYLHWEINKQGIIVNYKTEGNRCY